MIKQRRSFIALALAALALLMSTVGPVMAHSTWSYYSSKWNTQTLHRHCTALILFCSDHWHQQNIQHWTYGGGWDSTRQNDIIASQAQWDGNPTSQNFDYEFMYQQWDTRSSNPCSNDFMQNIHRWAYIDGNPSGFNTWGSASRCVFDDGSGTPKIKSFVITYDSGNSWSFGSGGPGSGQVDFRTVATHELGHATGWSSHFSEGSSDCPSPNTNTSRQTMCGNLGNAGTSTWARTTESHDDHTFSGAYGGTPT